MELQSHTKKTLRNCQSIHMPKGFHTKNEIRTFWQKQGAAGFLNIKEITPQMVREIREKIIAGE